MSYKSISSGTVLTSIQTRPYSLPFNLKLGKKAPIFFISLFGNTLEYFEYTIYSFLAPILALHFFPNDDTTVALIKAFGMIAVGSFAKPLGALIFGYIGDTRGRSLTLRYTMIGIAIPTFLFGLLPGYHSWGVMAIILLILCRIFQGIFMAAESDGVRIFVFEHFGSKYPCLISAFISCSAYSGTALASFVASQVPSEGEIWRWVFFGSGLCGILIYLLRRNLTETPPFMRLKENPERHITLKTILKTHWRSLIRTILICGAVGGLHHFYFVFQGTYLSRVLHLITPEFASQLSMYLLAIYVLTMPVAGWAADTWGYVRVGRMGGIITTCLGILNLILIMDEIVFVPAMIFTTISMAFFVAPGYLFLTQQYDVKIRFRTFSLGHAFGSMLFSGTAPVISLSIWHMSGISCTPYLYFLFLISVSAIAFSWRAKENAYNAWFL